MPRCGDSLSENFQSRRLLWEHYGTVVLSPREVERLLSATVKLRDRCLLMTVYAAGLRVTELIHLKLSDIHPERMMIRVEQGKGKKDRYTILSQRLLGDDTPATSSNLIASKL